MKMTRGRVDRACHQINVTMPSRRHACENRGAPASVPLMLNTARLLELIGDAPVVEFEPGDVVIKQRQALSHLYILKEGAVDIVRDGATISRVSNCGSTFGELSALLGITPTASVVAAKKSTFIDIDQPIAFLQENNEVTLEVARLLAHRVRWLTAQYVDELEDGDSSFWLYRKR